MAKYDHQAVVAEVHGADPQQQRGGNPIDSATEVSKP
jgi:hypothetical protein